MREFIIRRFFFALITVIGATVVVFSLSRAMGDPLLLYATPGGYGMSPQQIAALKKKLALDRPYAVQYLLWVGQVARGDLGETLLQRKDVGSFIATRVSATFELGLYAWLLATVIGVPVGALSAVKRGTIWDYGGRGFALLGQALPSFWLAIIFILIFSVHFRWFPVGTRGDHGWLDFKHVFLPMVTLAWGALAGYMRLTRSGMLEVLDSEFVKLARAKGVSEWRVVWKHAFRNGMFQPLTASALILAGFLNGVVLIETIFAWPGLGSLAVQAVNNNDFPVLQAIVLFFTAGFVAVNFATDILYALIDPRVRY